MSVKPKLSSNKRLVSDCSTVNHTGKFHTHVEPDGLTLTSERDLSAHALAHTNLIIVNMIPLASVYM